METVTRFSVLSLFRFEKKEREREREMSTTCFAGILRTDRVEFIKDARAS